MGKYMDENKYLIDNANFEINCRMIKKDVDIIFKSINFYRDCSILFTRNKEVAKHCDKVFMFLNEHCVQKVYGKE